ncbi:MAG: hypothetical protein OEM38_00450 [Gammaproteobacteria bacterium]|nr:hypothetical protein [Gammaproteobacteria bacterium]
MEYDLHSNIDERVAMTPALINSNTTTVGAIIDTHGYGSIEFIAIAGTITDGAYAFKIEDGDDSGLSDAADVSATLLLGALTGFALTDDNTAKRVGCISKKRYVRLSVVSTAVTTGVNMFSAVAVLGHPDTAPVAQ